MKDKIYTSVPINKSASIVTQQDNSRQIDGKEKYKQYMSLIKPPIRNNPFSNKSHDLTGLKVGKFTVIGMFIKQNPKKNAQWVVQCSCGYYTIRKAKSLNAYIDSVFIAQCERCMYIKNLSR